MNSNENIEKEKALQASIKGVCMVLNRLFEDDKDYYKENPDSNFKVRPYFTEYDKFYLDWIEGTYDKSLQLLIHYILFQKGYFRKLVSESTYEDLSYFMKAHPSNLYIFDSNVDERDLVDSVEWYCINFVRWLFKDNDMDDSAFIHAGYDLEPMLDNIRYHSYVFEEIWCFGSLADDLRKYVIAHKLTDNQKSTIMEVCKKEEDFESVSYVVEALNEQDNDLAVKIMNISIDNIQKKSELFLAALKIKQIFGDEVWATKVKESI